MKKGGVAVLATIIGAAAGAAGSEYFAQKQVKEKGAKIDKFKSYYNMLNQWLMLKQEGKSLEKYFLDHGYHSIAIYGMGEMGNRLYDELKGSSIEIRYAIDRNASGTYSDLDIIDPEDSFEEVDAVVVSAIFAFDEIAEIISGKISCPVISLDDVVFEM
ncbi:MAG: hypothetical protein ACI4F8_02880 [Lachnospiraceae bacterium]